MTSQSLSSNRDPRAIKARDNAAQHRAEPQAIYQQAGGRKAVRAAPVQDMKDKTDLVAVVKLANAQIDRLSKT